MISREWCGAHSDISVSARSASDIAEADTGAPLASTVGVPGEHGRPGDRPVRVRP